jgi:arsenate reductase
MQPLTVFHNPACSKSRRAVEILRERGVAFESVEYLKHPPSRATLEKLVTTSGIVATDLVRRDKRFAELALGDADCATPAQVVDLLVRHPELMERPVIVATGRAVIARPPERVLELLDA